MNALTDTAPLAPIESPGGAQLGIVIHDDGPGIEPDRRDTVMASGARLDESVPGSGMGLGLGLGLAIVNDLVGLCGGSVRLDIASMGGLRVEVELPRG